MRFAFCPEQNRGTRRSRAFYAPAMDERTPTNREPLWRHMLGDRLRELRHRRGATLGEIARRAGVSPQYLSEVERGIKEPSSQMIAAIARALEVTLVDLTLAVAESIIETTSIAAPVAVPARRGDFALAA
jgi:DNA-binding XRE family transcriptional regulator